MDKLRTPQKEGFLNNPIASARRELKSADKRVEIDNKAIMIAKINKK